MISRVRGALGSRLGPVAAILLALIQGGLLTSVARGVGPLHIAQAMAVDAHLDVVLATIESHLGAWAIPPTEERVVHLVAQARAVALALLGVRKLATSEPLSRSENQRTGNGGESEVAEGSRIHQIASSLACRSASL